ncbi:DUF4221 family protein [Algoriphagus namhaensis]
MALTIFSCSEKEEQISNSNILESLSLEIDTVVVDPGDYLINLEATVDFAISEDQSILYQFNGLNDEVFEINIIDATLDAVYSFEREGPNGIGVNANNFQWLAPDNFSFGSINSLGIFDQEGNKIKDISLGKNDLAGLPSAFESNLYQRVKITPEGKYALSVPQDEEGGLEGLYRVNLNTNKAKLIPIPAFDEIVRKFYLKLRAENVTSVFSDFVQQEIVNGKVLLTANSTSETYVFDPKTASINLVSFTHALVPSKRAGDYSQALSSQEKFNEQRAEISQQISFGKFMWDAGNKRYYRIATQRKPSLDEKTPSRTITYLFSYDQQFNLTGEREMKEFTRPPIFPFFTDGKMYAIVNVDDELGFAVFTFNFN